VVIEDEPAIAEAGASANLARRRARAALR
jgi:hypothetical protein